MEGHRKTKRTWNVAGDAHELTFSCYQRRPFLQSDRTKGWFLESLSRAKDRWSVEVWAYVVMTTHVHLVIHPRQADHSVSKMLLAIKKPVAVRALRYLREARPDALAQLAHVLPGGRVEYRFWQEGSGFDRNLKSPEEIWACIDCIHENPVRQGLAEQPGDYRWSTAAFYEGRPPEGTPSTGARW